MGVFKNLADTFLAPLVRPPRRPWQIPLYGKPSPVTVLIRRDEEEQVHKFKRKPKRKRIVNTEGKVSYTMTPDEVQKIVKIHRGVDIREYRITRNEIRRRHQKRFVGVFGSPAKAKHASTT